MNKEVLVEAKNVGLKYTKKKSFKKAIKSDEFWALKSISFKLFKGEVLGVTGANGAGKSTLLSLLAGITAPSSGSIVFNTEKVSLLSLQAGFVPYLSGRKNIYLSGMLMGLTREEIERKEYDIIIYSGILQFIDEPVVTYSSGMKARLGFSIAVNIDPDVILIDEVLGVGDNKFKKKSKQTLRDRFIEGDNTAVIVSHSAQTISELCDRVIWIEDGKVLEEGAPDIIVEKYF